MKLNIDVRSDLEQSDDPTLRYFSELGEETTTDEAWEAIQTIRDEWLQAIDRELVAAATRLGHELVHEEVGSPDWSAWRRLPDDEQDRLFDEHRSVVDAIWEEAGRDATLQNIDLEFRERAHGAAK